MNNKDKIEKILNEKFSSRDDLLNHLENNTKIFKDSKIKKAFEKIDRADFVNEDYKCEAYEDYPIPIGHEQTISQPTTLAFMLGLLDLKEGDRVLDIGSGSGWSTVLLSEIVGNKGSVKGLEIISELVEFGKKNLAKYLPAQEGKFKNTTISKVEKIEGEYNKILVSAGFKNKVPEEFIKHLKSDGVMVAPVDNNICKLVKDKDGKINQSCHEGFIFVPYIY